jgi:hypothetical protein
MLVQQQRKAAMTSHNYQNLPPWNQTIDNSESKGDAIFSFLNMNGEN